jgi:hypothetical protein
MTRLRAVCATQAAVGCAVAEDSDAAGGVVDDGQDVETGAGQGCRFEEVGGDDRMGLGPQEHRPGAAGALGCRLDTGVLENFPDGGGGDLDAQHEELAVDSAISPGGVFRGEAQDEPADGPDGSWPSGLVGPGTSGVSAGDQVAVRAQHGLQADQEP